MKTKVSIFQITAIVLYFMAVAWNLNSGGIYNLEVGIGALVLGLIKVWEDYLK